MICNPVIVVHLNFYFVVEYVITLNLNMFNLLTIHKKEFLANIEKPFFD